MMSAPVAATGIDVIGAGSGVGDWDGDRAVGAAIRERTPVTSISVSVLHPAMLQPLHCLLLAAAVLLCNAAPTEKHEGPDTKCPLMVKILDAVKGTPAGSVTLRVSQKAADGGWTQIANGETDATGEIHNLITEEQFQAGVYRVEFDTKAYWKKEGSTPFHEVADVVFEAHPDGQHHHYTLALLLSPFSYTTTAVVSKSQH